MSIKNHYGIAVDSEVPTTGVFQNNHTEWLMEDAFEGIDLDYQDHLSFCEEEDHDDCYLESSSNYLIGFKETELSDLDAWYAWETPNLKLALKPDPEAEYSAIVGEIDTQVVASKWLIRCAPCSPCYPGQGDADTPGDFLAYSLPPDVVGDGKPEKERIFLAK
jgi:hypothetical protein